MKPLWIILLVAAVLAFAALVRSLWFWVVKNSKNAEVQHLSRKAAVKIEAETLSGSRVSQLLDDEQPAPAARTTQSRTARITPAELRRAFILKTLIDEPRWRDE